MDRVARIMAQWQRVRPDVDVTPLSVMGRMFRVTDRLVEERHALATSFGVGWGEYEVLIALLRCGAPYEMSPTDLADWTVVSSGAATKRVDRCAEQGWVTRRAGERDGRSRVVALTEEGYALATALFDAQNRRIAELVEPLADEEQELLADILGKWSAALGD